ncbi:hypothetical protein ABT010_36715 [Streptomyces sp. NPDC002668]|uniref:hypothetical protein n=1 Tax=Streptomyces sp. NPDC002668 TaxID=3154422 RepID=UPI003333A059
MPTRKHTAVAIAAAGAVLTLAGCGKSADDIFSNLNGTNSSSSHDTHTSGPDASRSDAPPNYADNNRGRAARRDESAGQHASQAEGH